MSVANNPAANRIYQEFDTEFLKLLATSPRVWTRFAMEIPSSSRSTMHAWLSDEAQVREWKGSRILNEMGTLVWEVVNRDWEISWKFRDQQIQDDLAGLVALAIQRARGYAQKWARHEDTLIASTVQAGVSKACYDGQNYFSATHPTDPLGVVAGTFSNYFTAKPLNQANLITLLQNLRSLKLPDGSPWIGPQTKIQLIHEATNEFVAKQLCESKWFTPGTAYGLAGTTGPSENLVAGVCEPVLNTYLNSEPGVWYLAAEDAGLRPIMLQRRQAVESEELGPGSQLYFDRKEYQIAQDARYEASYTHPQLMTRVEPT